MFRKPKRKLDDTWAPRNIRKRTDEEEEEKTEEQNILAVGIGKDPSSSTVAPTVTHSQYTPQRHWLELDKNEKGEYTHIVGLTRRTYDAKWAKNRLFNQDLINEVIAEIKNLRGRNAITEMRDEMHRLLMHAPNNRDILLFCVESEEMFNGRVENVCQREGFLRCILELDPNDDDSKRKRLSILGQVDQLDDELLEQIDELMNNYRAKPSIEPEEEMRRKRQAHNVRRIYNTVAIEGNTLSLEEVQTVLDDPNARIQGHSEAEHKEVIGMRNVIGFIDKLRLEGRLKVGNFNLEDLLEMHRHILCDQPTNGGQLRTVPVAITGVPFIPPSPEKVVPEMRKFIHFLNNKPTAMHGVEFAALVHSAFVYLHPMVDGNGRMARLLLDLALEDTGHIHVIVPVKQRTEYMDTIFYGNMGDFRKFIRYIIKLLKIRLQKYNQDGAFSPIDSDAL